MKIKRTYEIEVEVEVEVGTETFNPTHGAGADEEYSVAKSARAADYTAVLVALQDAIDDDLEAIGEHV